MKKTLLMLTMVSMTMIAAGCSHKVSETSAATETAENTISEETDEDGTDEDIAEETDVYGTITKIDGNILTISGDEDLTEKNYDISSAEITREYDLAVGDYVYVEFIADGSDPLSASVLEVEASALSEIMDANISGTVVSYADGLLTLDTNNEEYTFASGNAFIVTKNGVKEGDDAVVTYIGALDDEPMAVKVVTADAADSEDADKSALSGTVVDINEDAETITLQLDNEDFYTFQYFDDLSGFSKGNTVRIYYEGKTTDRGLEALDIQKL